MFSAAFFNSKPNGFAALSENSSYSSFEEDHTNVEQPILAPQDITLDMLKAKYFKDFQQFHLSESDIQSIVSDDEQFRKMKNALRKQQCHTDCMFHQMSVQLLHNRKKELLLEKRQKHQQVLSQELETVQEHPSEFRWNDNRTKARQDIFLIRKMSSRLLNPAA